MIADTPQNGDEAAYISFALVDALCDMLVSKGVVAREDIVAVFSAASIKLSQSPNSSGARGAEFLRRVRLSKP